MSCRVIAPASTTFSGRVLDVVDLEPDVMQTDERRPELGTGGIVGFELQDREVDGAVAQDVTVVGLALRRSDPAELEHVDVELRGCVGIVGRDCQMTEFGHGSSSGGTCAQSGRSKSDSSRADRVDYTYSMASETWRRPAGGPALAPRSVIHIDDTLPAERIVGSSASPISLTPLTSAGL